MIPVILKVGIPLALTFIGIVLFSNFGRDHHSTTSSNSHQQPSGFFSCVLCLKSFDAFKRKLQLPCSHFLHVECARTLFTQERNTCPLCRKEVSLESLRSLY